MSDGKQDWMEGIDGMIDEECLNLCHALNALPGIKTIESCSGHGRAGFAIYFVADNLDAVVPVAYFADGCHSGYYGWKVIAHTDCSMDRLKFTFAGPIGFFTWAEADKIAGKILEWLNQPREVKS